MKKLLNKITPPHINVLSLLGHSSCNRLNITKTIYFNLKAFPFEIAIKLPVLIYGNIRIFSVGEVLLDSVVKKGMISLGKYVSSESFRSFSTWDNHGQVIIKGRLIFNNGFLFRNYGVCEFGRNVNLGSNLEIFCQEKIIWGNNVRTAANGFYMDTDGHFMFDLNTQKVSKMTNPIIIGNSVWLGNSVRLKKGTIIPDKTIVASFSVLGKDYTKEGERLVIGGIPATILKRNILPILNLKEEGELKKTYFNNEKGCNLLLSNSDETYLTECETNFF